MQRSIALFGHNISYSISPVIHNTAFSVKQLPFIYITVDIDPGRFDKAIEAVQTLKFAGANITIPFKESVKKFATSLSETAKKIGAVNTLLFDGDNIHGDNTDSAGFFNAYLTEPQMLKNKTVLIIGAGGAARAVCDAIITNISPERIFIANRNSDRSDILVQHLVDEYNYKNAIAIQMQTDSLQSIADKAAGIIQTTPVGSGKYAGKNPLPDAFNFHKNQVVIDLIYNPVETPLLKNAARHGARTRNGISMLLHQAALSFELWTGVTFPMNEVTPVVMEKIKR